MFSFPALSAAGHPIVPFSTPSVAFLSILPLVLLGFLAKLYASSSRPINTSIPYYRWDTTTGGGAKKRWMWDSVNLLRAGYHKFYNKPWQIWTTEGPHVVLPPSYLDELKMLPDHTFASSLRQFMLPQYTLHPMPPSKLDYVNHVIQHDMNKNMAKVFPAMSEEANTAIAIEFPATDDWSEIDLTMQVLRVTCRVAGRAFVGTGLHRNEKWIEISCNYTKDFFVSTLKLRAVPSFLRPLIYRFIPDIRRVYQHHADARDLVKPILQERERNEKTVPSYTKPNDTIEWVRDTIPEKDKKNYLYQGMMQLAITAVSIQSTSKLLVNIMLNLIAYPEYVPVLKEEIESTLSESKGQWTLESMSRLEKLDSFMRESLRFEPPLTATFQRQAIKPVKLKDGTILPPGTLILTPSDAIAFDPNIYPDPDIFDGLRFYKLRRMQVDGEAAARASEIRHQFAWTGKTQVQFGLGRHACPGRWFAGHLIKLVIVTTIMKYEFRFRDGEERPKTRLFQTTNMPDPKTRILARSRRSI